MRFLEEWISDCLETRYNISWVKWPGFQHFQHLQRWPISLCATEMSFVWMICWYVRHMCPDISSKYFLNIYDLELIRRISWMIRRLKWLSYGLVVLRLQDVFRSSNDLCYMHSFFWGWLARHVHPEFFGQFRGKAMKRPSKKAGKNS